MYFMERVYRVIRSNRSTQMTGVLMHPSGAMEIRFVKPSFKYKAGQWLFLNVPEVSQWQWHPFTISSAPDDPYVSVHVRQVGDFTCALGERLGATVSLAAQLTAEASKGNEKGFDPDEFMDVSAVSGRPLPALKIDGPFGAPAEDVFKYEVALLVGAGIGVTPFASILKNIWYMQQKNKLGALRRVEFFWVNKDTGSFEWFQSLLKNLEDAQTDNSFLRINTYLTQKMSADMIANVSINDAGAEFDALTQLKSRTQFGRPNWTQIYNAVRNGIETGNFLPGREASLRTRVATFYCGPTPLAKELKAQCKTATTKNIMFSFHKEHF